VNKFQHKHKAHENSSFVFFNIYHWIFIALSVDSVAVLQSFIDSLNAVPVVSLEPNEKYLKTLSHVYIPSEEKYGKDPIQIELLEDFLELRYACKLDFLYEDSTNAVRDMVFEVSQNKEEVFSGLCLKLSIIE
jgi:hypothetical protein